MLIAVNRVPVAAAIIERNRKFLLARRKDGGPHDGMWEFPGGKIESGETPEQALVREIQEELGVTISPGRRIGPVNWDYAEISVSILGITATVATGSIETKRLADHDGTTWVSVDRARQLPLLPADRLMLDLLEAEKPGH